MPLDAQKLRDFYGSPLGDLARRLIGRIVRARWLGAAGLTVAALGYGSPYLDRFRETATRCLALMPAQQGAAVWPEPDRCAVALVEAGMLPLPDNSVDRLLIAHALEAAERPAELLEEAWRVVAPEGRILAIVPSRRGVWARADGTPFGYGVPYSQDAIAGDPPGRRVFAGLLGGGPVCAAHRSKVRDSLRADDRAPGRSPLLCLSPGSTWSRRSSRSIGRSASTPFRSRGGSSSPTRSRQARAGRLMAAPIMRRFDPWRPGSRWTKAFLIIKRGEDRCRIANACWSCCATARATGT